MRRSQIFLICLLAIGCSKIPSKEPLVVAAGKIELPAVANENMDAIILQEQFKEDEPGPVQEEKQIPLPSVVQQQPKPPKVTLLTPKTSKVVQGYDTPQAAADAYINILLANRTLESAVFVRVEMISARHTKLDRRFWRTVVYHARYVSQGGFVNDRNIAVGVCDVGNNNWQITPGVALSGPIPWN